MVYFCETIAVAAVEKLSKMQTLQQLADYCFMQGYPSTQFMMTIHGHEDCKVELQNPNRHCYYPAEEPELLDLIKHLGYEHSKFGFMKIESIATKSEHTINFSDDDPIDYKGSYRYLLDRSMIKSGFENEAGQSLIEAETLPMYRERLIGRVSGLIYELTNLDEETVLLSIIDALEDISFKRKVAAQKN